MWGAQTAAAILEKCPPPQPHPQYDNVLFFLVCAKLLHSVGSVYILSVESLNLGSIGVGALHSSAGRDFLNYQRGTCKKRR